MWASFGGSQPFRMVSADLNVDGRLEVFGLAEDDSVWHNLQITPSVDDWTGWSTFGRSEFVWPFGRFWSLVEGGLSRLGNLLPGGNSPGLGALAVHRGSFGHMGAFGVARDGSAWINRQGSPFFRWQGWRPFGFVPNPRTGPFGFGSNPQTRPPPGSPAGGLREVVVPSTGLGVPLVFGLGVDDTVWINRSTRPYEPEVWSGWQQLGRGSVFNSLTVGQPGTSTVEVIGIDPDNTVWRNEAPIAVDPTRPVHPLDAQGGLWSGWQPFGAPSDQFRAVMALGFPVTFTSEVFGLALDDTIWRREAGSTAWLQFGTPADRLSTIVPMISLAGVAVGVAGTAPDGTVWCADRAVPSGQWGPLQPLGSDRRQLRQLHVTRDNYARMHAFGADEDGNVWYQAQTTPGTWQ
jgi:hypothetical protein